MDQAEKLDAGYCPKAPAQPVGEYVNDSAEQRADLDAAFKAIQEVERIHGRLVWVDSETLAESLDKFLPHRRSVWAK